MKRPFIAVAAVVTLLSILIFAVLGRPGIDPTPLATPAPSSGTAERSFKPSDLPPLALPAGAESLPEEACVPGAEERVISTLRETASFAYTADGILDGFGPIRLSGGWRADTGMYQFSFGVPVNNADLVSIAGQDFVRPSTSLSWQNVTGQYVDPASGTSLLSYDQASSIIAIPDLNWSASFDDGGCLLTGIFVLAAPAADDDRASPDPSPTPGLADADPLTLYAVELRPRSDYTAGAMRVYMPQATGDGGVAGSYYEYAFDYDAAVEIPQVDDDPVAPTLQAIKERLEASGISDIEVLRGPEAFEDANLFAWRKGRMLGLNLYGNDGIGLLSQMTIVPTEFPLADVFAIPSAEGGYYAVVFNTDGVKSLEIATADDQPVKTFDVPAGPVAVIDIDEAAGDLWRLLDADGGVILSSNDYYADVEPSPSESFEIPAY